MPPTQGMISIRRPWKSRSSTFIWDVVDFLAPRVKTHKSLSSFDHIFSNTVNQSFDSPIKNAKPFQLANVW